MASNEPFAVRCLSVIRDHDVHERVSSSLIKPGQELVTGSIEETWNPAR